MRWMQLLLSRVSLVSGVALVVLLPAFGLAGALGLSGARPRMQATTTGTTTLGTHTCSMADNDEAQGTSVLRLQADTSGLDAGALVNLPDLLAQAATVITNRAQGLGATAVSVQSVDTNQISAIFAGVSTETAIMLTTRIGELRFEEPRIDPQTGDQQNDPATGQPLWMPVSRLVRMGRPLL